MQTAGLSRGFDRVAAGIGVALIAFAGVIAWQATTIPDASGYGLGPSAMMYVVGSGLAVLGFGHLVTAVRGGLPDREQADWSAVAWIGAGLAAVIVAVSFGGGFIPAMALLFTATARGFGRRAVLVDLLIGLSLGLVIYLLFTKLLTLSLPVGPLERLI